MENPFQAAIDFIAQLPASSKVAIVGSRVYDKPALVADFVDQMPASIIVVSGGARGVDSMAAKAAKLRCMEVQIFRANWKKYDKSAGMIRNYELCRSGLSCLVAFRCSGKSNGTDHVVRIARDSGIQVFVF